MVERAGYLLTGGEQSQLLPALRRAIAHATDIEIAVSFIKVSGLDLIFDDLEAVVSREENPVKLTLLTSDYLCVTDPRALRQLMLLEERGADIRIFEAGDKGSFHLKTYIFVRSRSGRTESADAFVGSSNISKVALTDGLEWNYHIDYPNHRDSHAEQRIQEIRAQFARLIGQDGVVPLSHAWIEQYETRYAASHKVRPIFAVAPGADEAEPPPAQPLPHQTEALAALAAARARGEQKGLVVLATGMGKTFLAAFDAQQLVARRVLFVAHREEILLQAEKSFLAVMPKKRIGRYTGQQKDRNVDLLFASVQTLGRQAHLNRFEPSYFDYIVVDEFHHAAAGSYRKLLEYFQPTFLLGLTATPERTDRADILRLCDHNLVYRRDLAEGINQQQLCPFHYYGIFDAEVDYEHIPWRNGQFDPERLTNKLATLGRARHVLREWKARKQARTLAFCASRRHADFMADQFTKEGIAAVSVHSESDMGRSEALERLAAGTLKVVFSVDLFNEGVDLPAIDTVMMLRPTESRILFLQQLGRGLRTHADKSHLVVLDFVGNHHSFLNRPALLYGSAFTASPSRQQLLKAVREGDKLLPDGCFANYDLAFIEFLETLVSDGLQTQYRKLKTALGRRATLEELWTSGASLGQLRQQYGCWWELVDEMGDATEDELALIELAVQWFRDLTVTKTAKSYKLVLLQTLLDRKAIGATVDEQALAAWGKEWFLANPQWQEDLPVSLKPLDGVRAGKWATHWRNMPIKYWATPESSGITWFEHTNGVWTFRQSVDAALLEAFVGMTQEILDWRFAQYRASRLNAADETPPKVGPDLSQWEVEELPFFPNIKIACGHFKTGTADAEAYLPAPTGFGKLSAERHFIAQASGNSMNGGKQPIHDGDYLLLERITSDSAGSISNAIVAIERQDETGDNQYLLRKVLKNADGRYTLRAQNPDYVDLIADQQMTTFARLKGRVEPQNLPELTRKRTPEESCELKD